MCASLAFAAGCGGDDDPPPAPPSSADEAPEPEERCGFGPADDIEKVVLTTNDGVELAAARFGQGERGLVLVHQRGSDLCGWFAHARRWAGEGYQVLAFDQRCDGLSECGGPEPALDVMAAAVQLRRDGASTVQLVGASRGAAIALVAAAHGETEADSVVSLSAHDASFAAAATAPTSPADAAAGLKVPLLFACATDDPSAFCGERDQGFFTAVAATDKKLIELKGSSLHGWDMLGTIESDVDTFLAAHAG
ncbi:alpha/beta hydrolase [Asanoa sp. WMMD1127]|uniref:alpha/beta hydrolase n=1 Tax=Asanoa sp. WMMD1127 TaxID=3016107 RepID=UPI002416BDA6|nr:alpha/beta hydrolase [Asanoa sp. WMMD1127]MDG4826630.1 alpha/beta hydrolase [Asanoa sp. WMMD1127]